LKLLVPKRINPGNKIETASEPDVGEVDFNVFKFGNRVKPVNKEDIIVVGCFSEFGCEIVGAMYCIPRLIKKYVGKYFIVVGWYGREYLYRHLVDEFWEIKEEHMWLREYARAFHNESKNLKTLEKSLISKCNFIPSEYLGKMAVSATCNDCKALWGDISYVKNCKYCKSENVNRSMFGDVNKTKKDVVKIPTPSIDKLKAVSKYLGKNPVGIFARARQCYGRNLQPEFYVKLIELLESKGYSPIWLGEKQSTLPCPVSHIVDFSRLEESRDLELTFAIVKQLEFTIQFWTASSRLSAIMETPYILFESPDQIWGNGQEGFRLNLTAFGPRKLVISHYLNVYEDNISALNLVDRSVNEIRDGNFEVLFGLLENESVAKDMMKKNNSRIGGE